MHKDQLDGLLALKLVADKRSFTTAAWELGISPPAISQIIKQLESRLGVALLTRTTRSIHLTEAGEHFLNQAGPALDQIQTAMENVGAYAAKPSGLLRLNLPRAVYPTYMAPVIANFNKKFPEITVELIFQDEETDVVAQGFDAGIRLSDTLAKDMVAIKLFGPVRFVTSGAPEYLNIAGRPKHPRDLLAHNCLCIRFGNADIYNRWEYVQKVNAFSVHVNGTLIMNDVFMLVSAAVDGAGLIYTTEDSISDQLKSGKLEAVLNPYAATSTGFYLYYPQRSQVLPKLRAFIDHIREANETNLAKER
jgi:DNA-binding transcriptional LysR family regulator